MSYGGYLDLPTLLSAQRPISRPEHHDELLFIIQHQTTELWLKLVLHELETAARPAARRRARAGAQVRRARQAHPEDAHRAVVGARDAHAHRVRPVPRRARQRERVPVLPVPRGRVRARQQERRRCCRSSSRMPRPPRSCATRSSRPASTTSSSASSPAPATRSRRRCSIATSPRRGRSSPSSCRCSPSIYANPDEHWAAYETCEELVDLEDNFQLWRFRHLKTVERIIGSKTGTGGSSGAPFLKRALELTFFPELYAVRTEIPG